MAETPEEVARRLIAETLCTRDDIASALRAQYVAGLMRGAREAEEFDPDGGIGDPLAARIRALAEQAKEK